MARRSVAYVPQEANVFPSLTVRENLEVAGYLERGITLLPHGGYVVRPGKNVTGFQLQAFGIGSAFAGLAGALYAHYTSFIVPELFVPLLTIYMFFAVVTGGRGNNYGVILGTCLVIFFLESSRFATGILPFLSPVQIAAGRGMLIGIGFLLVLRYFQRGLLAERTDNRPPTSANSA